MSFFAVTVYVVVSHFILREVEFYHKTSACKVKPCNILSRSLSSKCQVHTVMM